MFLEHKVFYLIFKKGCVRSITEYYILQHELTTAMQYH